MTTQDEYDELDLDKDYLYDSDDEDEKDDAEDIAEHLAELADDLLDDIGVLAVDAYEVGRSIAAIMPQLAPVIKLDNGSLSYQNYLKPLTPADMNLQPLWGRSYYVAPLVRGYHDELLYLCVVEKQFFVACEGSRTDIFDNPKAALEHAVKQFNIQIGMAKEALNPVRIFCVLEQEANWPPFFIFADWKE
jgi:hypothetical protein